jgi:hypothetical protein
MSTIYDFLTVGAFIAMALGYFAWGRNDQRLLLHMLLSAVTFAVANQLGNNGYGLFAFALLAVGAGYAAYLLHNKRNAESE